MEDKLGRDFMQVSRQVTDLLERGVVALEKLASDPQVEIEAGPPFCPHCGMHDPTIQITQDSGEGPLSEFLIVGTCGTCGEKMYGLVESYSMHRNIESLKHEIAIRKGGNGQ